MTVMTHAKTYFQFDVTHKDGSRLRVPVVSIGDHDQARAFLLDEYQKMYGECSIRTWPSVTHWLPPDLSIPLFDGVIERPADKLTCWTTRGEDNSPGRIDDFVFGIGDGVLRPHDTAPVKIGVFVRQSPRFLERLLIRTCMFRDVTMAELVGTASREGVWFAHARVEHAVRRLKAKGRMSVVVDSSEENYRYAAVPRKP